MRLALVAFLALTGCSTLQYKDITCRRPDLWSPSQEQQACIGRIERAKADDEAAAEKEAEAEAARQALAEKAWDIGTPKATFDYYFQPPPEQGVVDGRLVYWYRDLDRPIFVFFVNDKLASVRVDYATIKAREQAARERQTQQKLDAILANQENAARWNAINASIQQTQLNQIERNTRPVYQFQPINQRTH